MKTASNNMFWPNLGNNEAFQFQRDITHFIQFKPFKLVQNPFLSWLKRPTETIINTYYSDAVLQRSSSEATNRLVINVSDVLMFCYFQEFTVLATDDRVNIDGFLLCTENHVW